MESNMPNKIDIDIDAKADAAIKHVAKKYQPMVIEKQQEAPDNRVSKFFHRKDKRPYFAEYGWSERNNILHAVQKAIKKGDKKLAEAIFSKLPSDYGHEEFKNHEKCLNNLSHHCRQVFRLAIDNGMDELAKKIFDFKLRDNDSYKVQLRDEISGTFGAPIISLTPHKIKLLLYANDKGSAEVVQNIMQNVPKEIIPSIKERIMEDHGGNAAKEFDAMCVKYVTVPATAPSVPVQTTISNLSIENVETTKTPPGQTTISNLLIENVETTPTTPTTERAVSLIRSNSVSSHLSVG
jgi:hypothetical protein